MATKKLKNNIEREIVKLETLKWYIAKKGLTFDKIVDDINNTYNGAGSDEWCGYMEVFNERVDRKVNEIIGEKNGIK